MCFFLYILEEFSDGSAAAASTVTLLQTTLHLRLWYTFSVRQDYSSPLLYTRFWVSTCILILMCSVLLFIAILMRIYNKWPSIACSSKPMPNMSLLKYNTEGWWGSRREPRFLQTAGHPRSGAAIHRISQERVWGDQTQR